VILEAEEEGFEPSIPRLEVLRGDDIAVVHHCSKTPASKRIFPVFSSQVFVVVHAVGVSVGVNGVSFDIGPHA
jgi:hypothetical protein